MINLDSQKKVYLSIEELRMLSEELELLEKCLGETRTAKERFLLFRKLKYRMKQLLAGATDL